MDVFCRRLGCPLESTQTDMEVQIALESFTSVRYGIVYHTRAPEPVGGLHVAFITVGDCELEFSRISMRLRAAKWHEVVPAAQSKIKVPSAALLLPAGPGCTTSRSRLPTSMARLQA